MLDKVEKVKEVVHFDWRFYLTGLGLLVVNLIAAWDATAVSVALPTIAMALKGSALQSFWIGTAFLVAATIVIPLYSTCADILGRKVPFLASLGFFTMGSFITAIVGRFSVLLLGRSIQGIGAGGIYVLSKIIVEDLVSDTDRRNWRMIIGTTWIVGIITGPIIGGSLAENGNWRWIFWINLPFCGLAYLIFPIFAQMKPASSGLVLHKLARVDWVGNVLFACSLIAFLLGLSWGGITYIWSDSRTVLSILFGLVGFILFLVWSYFSPFTPIITLSPFLNLTSIATYFSGLVQGAVSFSALYFLPLFFQVFKPTITITESAIWIFPWTFTFSVFTLLTYIVIGRLFSYRMMVWGGWAFLALGTGLTTLFTRTIGTPMWICIALWSGAGLGMLYPSIHIASRIPSPLQLKDGDVREAITNFTFFQTLGQALGVAVAGITFQNGLYDQLRGNELLQRLALQYARDAVAYSTVVRGMEGETGSLRTVLQDAYITSFKHIYVTMAALAGAAFAVSFLMRPVPKERDEVKGGEA
ncbi:MFS general substrate transporter [Lojkania enalia]|uniref:MFS general substrate transporter n=1 Tax=Lojkania enalia TaxID=147567 RepID=A0A9P4K8X1_9PLEO|nr:MFS general substrate transporter [Didymosphaeria enalia]